MPVRPPMQQMGPAAPTNLPSINAPEGPDLTPNIAETWHSAFALDNDIANIIELQNRPKFAPTPDYASTLVTNLKKDGLWESYRDNFVDVKSDAEYDWMKGKLAKEQQDHDVIMRSGWSGTIAGVAAGLVSPTLFLPFLGEEKGLYAIGRGAVMGALGGYIQQMPAQANQASYDEGGLYRQIAMSTVLGGMLGGAHAYMTRGEFEAVAEDMAVPSYGRPIPTAAGADVAGVPFAGKLGKGAQTGANILDSNPLTRSPVTDTIMSDNTAAAHTMWQLSDAGLESEASQAGRQTNRGGTVENRREVWYGNNVEGIKALDDAYQTHVFGATKPAFFANARASISGYLNPGKMSRAEFNEQVTRAGWNNDVHDIPEVQAAAEGIRKAVYEPVLEEMKKVGMFANGEVEALGDPSYMNRMFDRQEIKRDPTAFIDFLAGHYEKKLQEDFAEHVGKFTERQARSEETLTDAMRGEDQIAQLKEEFTQKLKDLEATHEDDQFSALEDTMSALRGAARQIDSSTLAGAEQRKSMLRDARDMEKAAGEPYATFKKTRSELKRRLQNFNKARVVVAEKLAKKLEKIDRAEDLSMSTLNRAAKAGYRILSKMDDWSDEVLNAELSKLKTTFGRAGEIYDKGEERITKLIGEENPDEMKVLGLEATQKQRAEKMTSISEKIADAEDLGRGALRDLINDELQANLQKIKDINDRRAVRTARLREQAKAMSPEVVGQKLTAMRSAIDAKTRNFEEAVRLRGGDNLDIQARTADFSTTAREAATAVKDKIMATYLRMPTVDIMQGERGAQLARVLNISSQDMSRWLEKDVEKLMHAHIRTMAPDIEIKRALGTVNGADQLSEGGTIAAEMNRQLEAVDKAVDAKGQPLSDAAKTKEKIRIQDEYNRVKANLEAVIGRLRHTHGLPSDPDGMAYRMAKTVMNLNVLRFMGGVTISSIPDIARPVMRYGLGRTFKQGWLPMIGNFKSLQMSAREGRLAGVGIDAITQSRAHAVLDVMEDYGRGSKFERGVEYATGKQGIIALFSHWTDVMKSITSAVSIGKITDSIADVALNAKPSNESINFLAQAGIGPQEVDRIWSAMAKEGGAAKVNGVWLPNTEAWQDAEAKMLFRQMLAREVNNTIVSPGVERPVWTTASTTGKMLSQFKSFAFSSTYKMAMSGMQQRDMAVMNGAILSLALGTLSYYAYAVGRGGDAYKKMQDATWEEWADQATQRSGILAGMGLGQDLLSRVPMTAPFVSFSGGRSSRRGGDDLVSAALGPSFDFATKSADVITQLQHPTKSVGHELRQLLPWQNVTILSRGFDQIEHMVNLPEGRK